MVMPSNLNGLASKLNELFPGRLGLLLSPNGWVSPRNLPFALDNGRFSVWSKGKKWFEEDFWKLINKAKQISYPPLWLAVPDVVANAEETIKEWKHWHPILSDLNWPLALVVQDGMEPNEVKNLLPKPDYIFVGGSTLWKWQNLTKWTETFPNKVHVGRVNSYGLLWKAHRAGVISSDRTGWFHHIQKKQLIKYLDRSSRDLGECDREGFFY